jgi:hypothetical protein
MSTCDFQGNSSAIAPALPISTQPAGEMKAGDGPLRFLQPQGACVVDDALVEAQDAKVGERRGELERGGEVE